MGFLERTYNGRKRMKKNSKGLSTIVATLIIILLVLVAVGILWVVIRNFINGNAEQIDLGKLTLDLAIQKIQLSGNDATVTLKRNVGQGEFVGIVFVFEDDQNSQSFTEYILMDEMNVRTFTFTLDPNKIDVDSLKKIKIYPVFKLKSGKEVEGPLKDEWEKGSQILQCTPTISCIGRVCGSDGCTANKCGSCTGTDVCNNGQCVPQQQCTDTCDSLGHECGDVCYEFCGSCTEQHSTNTCLPSGICNPICDSGWKSCDNDRKNGCERQLGTRTDCSDCDDNCGAGTCVSGACVQPACDLTSAGWNETDVLQGAPVRLNLIGTNCNGKTISFEIYEKDGALNSDENLTKDYPSNNPSNIVFTGSTSYGIWISQFTEDTDLMQSNPPEYYFIARVIGTTESIPSSTDNENLLIVNQPVQCGMYDCQAGETCSNCPVDCGVCPPVCGNDIKEGTEQCDGIDLGGANCVTTNGTGWTGIPTCYAAGLPNECKFNTAPCIPPCNHECTSVGSTQCFGSLIQTCVTNYDSDECREWGAAVACTPAGYTCVGGSCVANCTNTCQTRGATQCFGSLIQTCGDLDNNGCTEWGTAVSCPSGQTCVGNVCVASCATHSYLGCYNEDSYWYNSCDVREDLNVDCTSTETCSGGICISSCSAPDLQQAWILSYEQEILGKLTGVTEIAPGQKISSRSSSANRQLAREYFQSLWGGLGLEVHVQNFGSDGANVYAVLPATVSSTEWVIFGAHYDTVSGSPGADDDGTGITLVSAIARYATMLPCRSRNLMFVAFDKEEEGSIGAYALAQYLSNQDYNVHSFHDFEMLGWDSNDDRLYHVCKPSTGLFGMYQQVLTENPLPINLIVSAGGSSDYDAFEAYGFPIILLSEAWPGDSTPYYHSSRDSYSTIDFPYLELATNFENGVVKYLTQIN